MSESLVPLPGGSGLVFDSVVDGAVNQLPCLAGHQDRARACTAHCVGTRIGPECALSSLLCGQEKPWAVLSAQPYTGLSSGLPVRAGSGPW